ncbi:MAG TPA: class I SAM-dependent methyltransferase [Gaiellales bacterium]|nr:class I SAM-dependent methyltransferase [Gaiellales bacterium]
MSRSPIHRAVARVRRAFASPQKRRHALVGPASEWEVKRDFQIGFLKEHGLQPSDRLADIGCGTLRGGIPVIAYLEVGHYHGFEVRAEVLEEARRELAESGLEDKRPVLTQSDDLGSLRLEERFDVIWAFSVFVHLSDDVLGGVLDFVARQLAPAGVMYANVRTGDAEQGQWQGFPVVSRSVDAYREAAARHGLAVQELGTLESLGHPPGFGSRQVMLRITHAG